MYCEYDYGQNDVKKYYCDVNDSYYSSLQECNNNCGFRIDGQLVHLSMVDMTFIFAVWAALISAAIFFAFHISHD